MKLQFKCDIARFLHCALGIALAAGCASVDPQHDYLEAGAHTAKVVGQDLAFDPDNEDAALNAVNELLDDGITLDEAVQIALLNNPSLQAGFFRVGMSRADFVQSGLFSNPSLALSFAFPEGGGRSNIQGTLAQNIVDLWQIPIRKRIAQAKLDQEIMSLAQQAARLAIETKMAYFTSIATARNREIAGENLQLATGLLDTTLARQKAGSIGELDVNLVRSTVLNTELDVQTVRLDAANAMRRLAVLLGMTRNADELVILDPLPDADMSFLDENVIVELARTSRLDLQALNSAVVAGRQKVAEEYAKIFPDVALGTYFERSERRALPGRDIFADTARASVASGQLTAPEIQSRGERNAERRQEIDVILGPSLTMTLPIFDQNQAQIAKADYAYHAALKELDALDRQIVQDTRRAIDQATTAASLSRFYADKILPQTQTSLDLANVSYKSGKTSILLVLEAQRSVLATRRLAVTAQQNAANAWVELELVVGRPMSVIVAHAHATSQPPDEQPIEATTQPTEMESE
jgi:outer membrane protein, heavy metal efflux system